MLTFASTISDIAEIVRGTVPPVYRERLASGISTDTRTIKPGDVFVALVGEKMDGHAYVATALAADAAGAVVSRIPEGLSAEDYPLILVPDTLRAFGQLGAAARKASGATVIGITGSAGKTTVKNMIAAILGRIAPTLATVGTHNNEIGVPQTLLNLEPEHRYCVLELAMRGKGQIKYLADICQPQIGVITNIGESHIGLLGSRETIAQTKAELLSVLPGDGGAVLPRDDFFFDLFAELTPCAVRSFGGGEDADVQVAEVHIEGLEGVRFSLRAAGEEVEVFIAIPGQHIAMNAGAAAAACLCAGVSLADIAAGLEGFAEADMRMQIATSPAGVTVINDAYNASPPSVLAALDVLSAQEGRKIFIFGDMLELGAATEDAHRRVGSAAAKAGVAWMVTVGEAAALAADAAQAQGVSVERFSDKAEALALLKKQVRSGDVVLVKASRGIGLDTVAKGLLDEL